MVMANVTIDLIALKEQHGVSAQGSIAYREYSYIPVSDCIGLFSLGLGSKRILVAGMVPLAKFWRQNVIHHQKVLPGCRAWTRLMATPHALGALVPHTATLKWGK